MSARRTERIGPFAAGLIALALVALGSFLAFTRYDPFATDYRVQAVFRSALSEIRPRSPVRIAGVDVGEVTEVRRGPGGTAVVEMAIEDEGRPLHRDATMKLRPRLFLEGNFFVDVQPGSASAPELADGGTIPLSQTAIAVQADEVLSTLTYDTRQMARALVSGLADGLDDGGAEAFRRGAAELDGAATSTAIVMEALRGERHDDLSQFVRAQARISDRLAEHRHELAQLIGGFQRTMSAMADRRRDLSASVDHAHRVLRVAPPTLAALDGSLTPVREFAAAARPGLRAAPEVLDRSHPFLVEMGRLLADDELPALARDLRPGGRALSKLNRSLPGLLDLVDQVSRCVRDNVVATLEQQVPDGHLTTEQPAWQELLRFGTGLAGSQANFDGNGTSTRYGGLAGGQNVIAARQTPGDDLVMLSALPILGSRPRYDPRRQPPLRPDVPCEGQVVPDLRADTTPPPADQRRVRLRPAGPATERAR